MTDVSTFLPAVSCRLEVLPGDGVLDRMNAAVRFGFDAVSLPGRFLSDYLDDLRACRTDLPLPLVAMSLGFEGSLLSPDAEIRRACRDSLLRLFDICVELDVKSVNVPPVLVQDVPVRITDAGLFASVEAAQDALLLEQLPSLADEAGARGLLFLLEPVNRFETDYLTTVAHAAKLCSALGHESVGVTCDFFHMQLEELNIADALQSAGDWIKHVHVAENTRVEPGPGSMDFGPGFRALKEIAYRGCIEVECRSLSGPAEDVLPRSVEYLRTTWREA